MAYDPAARTMLMFGGFSDRTGSAGYLDDTRSWNGTTWRKLSPSASPPARTGASMAYDAATRSVLLFGGEGKLSRGLYGGSYGELSDTWSWSGTAWTRLSPPNSPPASDGSSIVYDPATATVLHLLGYGDGFGSDQTWSWNGSNWSKLSPSTSPPVGCCWSMAYDPATATVLLFGGVSNQPSPTGVLSPLVPRRGTWSWNGATWTKLSLASSPSASSGASVAYDPGTAAMLIVEEGNGDNRDGYARFNDTWALSRSGGHQPGL